MPQAQTARDPASWDALRRTAPSDSVFASPRWLRHTATMSGRDLLFITAPADGTPLAGAALLLGRRGPFRIATVPPMSAPSGVLLAATDDPGGTDAACAAVIAAISARVSFAQLHLPPDVPADPFTRLRGWTSGASDTLLVDLSDWDAAWARFSQSLRRKVRRADDLGFELIESADAAHMTALFAASYARHGILPPLPESMVRRWLDALLQDGLARLYFARCPDGAIAAGRVLIRDGAMVYDWLAGAELAERGRSASHWLVARLLERHAREGCRTFDFMGANTPGVVDFKRSFGGAPLRTQLVTWHRHRWLHAATALRGRLVRAGRGFR